MGTAAPPNLSPLGPRSHPTSELPCAVGSAPRPRLRPWLEGAGDEKMGGRQDSRAVPGDRSPRPGFDPHPHLRPTASETEAGCTHTREDGRDPRLPGGGPFPPPDFPWPRPHAQRLPQGRPLSRGSWDTLSLLGALDSSCSDRAEPKATIPPDPPEVTTAARGHCDSCRKAEGQTAGN